MRRREFIAFGVGAATWPFSSQAQKRAQVVGFLSGGSPETHGHFATAFREGLRHNGFVEGQNVWIEPRWVADKHDQVPALVDDLVSRKVDVILTGGSREALAVKKGAATIPIVFIGGSDPVALGLVSSLSRPGANVTGITQVGHALATKRFELLRLAVPTIGVVALIVNPRNPSTQAEIADAERAGRAMSIRTVALEASSEGDIEQAFVKVRADGVQALVVAADPVFNRLRDRFAALAAQYRLPAIYSLRENVIAGGVMSYGADFADTYRQAGTYVARS
jgi:putative ABC transport system substrate-binding protein